MAHRKPLGTVRVGTGGELRNGGANLMKGAEECIRCLIARMRAAYRKRKAERDLQRMVEQRRNSYETQRYRERRAAALKGVGRA